MNRSCFCAPIHKPKFARGREFVESYNAHYEDRDIFLVFSHEQDRSEFGRMSETLAYNSIVCTQELGASPITQKKYFGLDYIFQNTDFIHVAVVDVDALFIKRFNYDAAFEEKNANKIVYANLSTRDLMLRIAAESTQLFSPRDVEHINKVIRYNDEAVRYFWFNDVPLYKRELFLEYLDYTDYRNRIRQITYRNYDYVSYVYFLIAKGLVEVRTLDVTLPHGILEHQDGLPPDVFKQYFREMNASWVKLALDDEALMKNVFMRLHVDRC